MKVIVISAAFPPLRAGESDYVLWLCEQLAEQRHDVELVTTDRGPMPRPPGVSVSPLMHRWTWAEMPRLLLELRRKRPDIVLMPFLDWLYRRSPMVRFLPIALRRILPATRFYSLVFDATNATARTIDDSDGLLVFSESHAEILRRLRPKAGPKIHVLSASPLVAPAADAAAARRAGRARLKVDDNQFLFVNFGYIYPGKGIDTLLQAFARVSAVHPNARLALVGALADERFSGWATYGECLKHLAWALRIEEKIHWVGGFEPKSDLPSQCLFAGDAAALPFDGGIGLANTSAAASAWHGLPLLSTAGASVEPAFVTEENALLSTPRDVEGLARSMRRVIDDRALADRLHDGALDLARRWFSTERTLERLQQVLVAKVAIATFLLFSGVLFFEAPAFAKGGTALDPEEMLINGDEVEVVRGPLDGPTQPPRRREKSEAIPYVEKGRAHADAGDYDKARDAFQDALAIDPSSPTAHAGLARAWLGLGDLAKAAEPTQKAIALDSRLGEGHVDQAAIYLEAGQTALAVEQLKVAGELDPKDGRVPELRARHAVKEGRRDDAIAELVKATTLSPQMVSPHLTLAELYREKSQYREALLVYQKALKLKMSTTLGGDLHARLSAIYTALGQHNLAEKEARSALFADGAEPKYHLALGHALAASSDNESAIRAYLKALELDPKSTETYRSLAMSYLTTGRYALAVRSYLQILDVEPKNAAAHYDLANAYQRWHHVDKAVEHFQMTVALDPKHFDGYFNLGKIYRKEKKYDLAVQNMEKAAAINPAIVQVHEELGYGYRQTHQVDKAIASYKKALELSPESRTSRSNLGKLYLEDGRTDEAIAEFRNVLAKYPRHLDSQYGLGVAYCQKGEREQAEEMLKRTTKLKSPQASYLLVYISKNCLNGRKPASKAK